MRVPVWIILLFAAGLSVFAAVLVVRPWRVQDQVPACAGSEESCRSAAGIPIAGDVPRTQTTQIARTGATPATSAADSTPAETARTGDAPVSGSQAVSTAPMVSSPLSGRTTAPQPPETTADARDAGETGPNRQIAGASGGPANQVPDDAVPARPVANGTVSRETASAALPASAPAAPGSEAPGTASSGPTVAEWSDGASASPQTAETARDAAATGAAPADAAMEGAPEIERPRVVLTDPDQIRRAQRVLQERGLYAGAIDGIAGKLTERGLRTFQDRHGLPETGELTRATFARLTRGDGGAASASEASLTGR